MANSMIRSVSNNNVWYVDSGTSNHMTSHGEWFMETGDDTTHPITQIDKVPLSSKMGKQST
jgi:hypothetical protein